MNEQVKALLEKLELSEEAVSEIQTILEAAMRAAKEEGEKDAAEKAEAEMDELKESHAAEISFLKEKANEYGDYLKERANDYGDFLKEKANDYGDYLKEKANNYGEHIKESVSEKMKEYADYAVEQFIGENRERFVETEEYARMKSAFDYIKEAFEKNAFNVREDAAVAELQESLAESTRQYESLFEDMATAREELDGLKRTLLLERATADLAETQKEKVNELLESVSFDSLEEYENGLGMIVEQAKAAAATVVEDNKEEMLKESVDVVNPAKKVHSSIEKYLSRNLL